MPRPCISSSTRLAGSITPQPGTSHTPHEIGAPPSRSVAITTSTLARARGPDSRRRTIAARRSPECYECTRTQYEWVEGAGAMPSPTTPSRERLAALTIEVGAAAPPTATAIGIPVATDGPSDAVAGLAVGRSTLTAAGFDAAVGSAHAVAAASGATAIAVGIGAGATVDATALRSAAAAFARAARQHSALAFSLEGTGAVEPALAAQAVRGGHRPRPLPLRPTAGRQEHPCRGDHHRRPRCPTRRRCAPVPSAAARSPRSRRSPATSPTRRTTT